jgi:hypothetical protein
MGLMDKFLNKPKAKSVDVKSSESKPTTKSTYETSLSGVNAKNRQEVLMNLVKKEVLKVEPIFTGGTVGFEVFSADRKSLGTIPSKIAREMENALSSNLYPHVTNYVITKDKEGIFNCKVNLGLKKEK